jgi:hypothetical protein
MDIQELYKRTLEILGSVNNRRIMIIVVLVGLTIFGPLLTIWSLNTLFATGIAYSIKTWFAMFFINWVISNVLGRKI